MSTRSEYFDDLYRRFSALDAYDSQLLPDADAAALGSNGFLGEGELTLYEQRLRALMSGQGPLLDLGCGRGALGRWLSQRLRTSLVGVDASSVAVEHARRASKGADARFEVASFEHLPLGDRSVAGMISLDGMYLCAAEQRASAAEQLARVACVGAPLLMTISVPCDDDPAHSAWPVQLCRHGFEVIELHDLSAPWHDWLARKHERRLATGDALERMLGSAAAKDARAVSRAMLGGTPPRYTTQSRYRVTARYAP